MKDGIACTSINQFPKAPAQHARLLWGLLEEIRPSEEGLLNIRVSGKEYLVEECLLETLQPLIGRNVTIVRAYGPGSRWSVGQTKPLSPLANKSAAWEGAGCQGAIV